jgi:ornithine cyclodeaminase
VDTPAAKTEGGDVAVSIHKGAISEGHVRGTLTDLCRNPPQRSDKVVTVFKSVGTALEDLAAAMLVWRSVPKTS